jgi:hypothetical protein
MELSGRRAGYDPVSPAAHLRHTPPHAEVWREEWDLQWMRLEGIDLPVGQESLKTQKAMRELYGGFLKENPEFYLEGCRLESCHLDLNMARISHGT